MKNDPTATFLNFVLAALVILGVLFAVLSTWRDRNLRHMQPELQLRAQSYQPIYVRVIALANDAAAYNATAKNQEMTQILQSLQAQLAANK